MREQAWQRFRSSGRRSGRRRASPAAVAVAVGVMTMDALAPPDVAVTMQPSQAVKERMDGVVDTAMRR
ncbi:hypothetical protein ACIQWL_19790 [Streptomyces mirabilis]|uniref:hypothetical protein n=1 Tax=Streptomyces mirabilis TaxID=68239 RepID=UPI0033CA6019